MCVTGSGRAGGLLPTPHFPHLPPPALPPPAHGLAEPSLSGEPTGENKNLKPLHQGVIIHGERTLFPLKMIQETASIPNASAGPDTDPRVAHSAQGEATRHYVLPSGKRPPRLGRYWDERGGPVEPVAIRGSTAHLKRGESLLARPVARRRAARSEETSKKSGVFHEITNLNTMVGIGGKESTCQCRRHRSLPGPGSLHMLWRN